MFYMADLRNVYVSPSQIDEMWEKMKKRRPDTPREVAEEWVKDHIVFEDREDERIQVFCGCIKKVWNLVKDDTKWLSHMLWVANIDPEDFFAAMHAQVD